MKNINREEALNLKKGTKVFIHYVAKFGERRMLTAIAGSDLAKWMNKIQKIDPYYNMQIA